ncbi:MAG TPA: M48 family metallopeptidase [Bacteroidales bacterium]|nr:M48 family metallopeptidase [Bacteroidales bacterium]HRZ21213.1 M48 family metallopeptidase [Bacteroidales bacterium]
MAHTILTVIIIILAVDYIAERILDYLNSTYWSDTLPDELKGIYDAEKYKKSQAYLRVRQRFSILTDSISLLVMLLMLLLGGFAWLDQVVRGWTAHPILMALCFFGILGLAADLLSTPFSVYSTFVIEERFGFNKTTPRTFILDKLKGWLLGAILGGGILSLVVWLYLSTGNLFWILTWAAISLFSVFMTMFYSSLIVPLFNKQTPLAEGGLRDAIEQFAAKVRFRLDNIFVIDGSKRSGKANAYFSGLGAKKRIVLYDTLITDHTVDELVAVLAHEVGHYKKKHTRTGIFLSVIQTGLMLFVMSLFIGNPLLSQALGADQGSFHMGILAFGILYSPISMILGLGINYLSRKHEYEADRFAGVHFDARSLQEALKKLSVNNLSNLRPHPAYVFVYYSHPPVLKRLQALEGIKSAVGGRQSTI